jgi:hypothetical protein
VDLREMVSSPRQRADNGTGVAHSLAIQSTFALGFRICGIAVYIKRGSAL